MPKGVPKKSGEDQLLESGGAGAGAGTSAKSRLQSNIGADTVLKNLREKFGADKKIEATKSEAASSPRSVLEEAQRSKALDKFRRDEAAEKATTEGGVTKYPYVEPTSKKKGGMTASRRADGCAVRGKTRGKVM
jgi:hypothetical protein